MKFLLIWIAFTQSLSSPAISTGTIETATQQECSLVGQHMAELVNGVSDTFQVRFTCVPKPEVAAPPSRPASAP